MKFVSRTIPLKAEGIIPRPLGRYMGPWLALGFHTRDFLKFDLLDDMMIIRTFLFITKREDYLSSLENERVKEDLLS